MTNYVPQASGKFKAGGACFVRFYPTDWRSGCFGMTLQEEGLYIRICAFIFETGRRVPLDDSIAAKHLGIHTNAYRKVRDDLVAAGKLQAHEDGWGVRRAEAELSAAVAARERPIQDRAPSGSIDPPAEWNTPPDTIGDTPPDTPPDTPLDTPGVFSELANENNPPLIEPRANSQEEKENKILLRSDAKPKREAHGSRLDRDWALPDDWRQWARATFPQTTAERVTAEADTFRDYWIAQAGQKARKADWEATWRNWCRKAFATAPTRPRSQPPPASDRNEIARRMMAMLNTGASA